MEQQEVKNRILDRIKKGKPPSQPLPDIPLFPYTKNAEEDFISHLIGFDGKAVKFKNREEAIKWLMARPEMDAGQNVIFSSVDGVTGNMPEDDIKDHQKIEKIRTCVTEGIMGVGEMGAIWVTNASLKHAACALLSRKLFILLDYNNIVGGMHEAYSRLKLGEQQYGSFYTGPSATADIEAVRVTGAQGPLFVMALIYNSPNAPEKPEIIENPNPDSNKWIDTE